MGAGRGGRVRRPRPLLRERLPSGRGRASSPTRPTRRPASLVFWALLLATAVATGLLGSALMFLLTTVEHLAFGYDSGTLEGAFLGATPVALLVALALVKPLVTTLCLGSGMSEACSPRC